MNLYELIEYYRRQPLKSAAFRMILRDGVPQPAPHEERSWFHANTSRAEAEDMLKRIREDGAFLVRSSETTANSFAISFRAEGKTKHCRVRKEGRMYCIGDAEFERLVGLYFRQTVTFFSLTPPPLPPLPPSLVKLVEYYEKHPLYRKIKLRYPVDDELLARQGTDEPEDEIYNSDELYSQPNAFDHLASAEGGSSAEGSAPKSTGVTCRALYAYRASQEDELSFPKVGGGWGGVLYCSANDVTLPLPIKGCHHHQRGQERRWLVAGLLCRLEQHRMAAGQLRRRGEGGFEGAVFLLPATPSHGIYQQ